jgi:signal transduction histidine kinase
MVMGLRIRMVLTYTLMTGVLVVLICVLSNIVINRLFTAMVADNIAAQSGRIVLAMDDRYDAASGDFAVADVETLGMEYVHQGYIVSIRDNNGDVVWDARQCDMGQCVETIGTITARMQHQGGVSGGFSTADYPLIAGGQPVGTITIETFGPYFYSASEATFISGFNNLMIWLGIAAVVASGVVSLIWAGSLSRPITRAAQGVRRIADGDFQTRVQGAAHTREYRELATGINDLALALAGGERWQRQLTSDVAHELRTPLTLLQGNLEAIRDGVCEATPEMVDSLHEEARRLGRLVDDLGKISLLEQENLALEKSDFDLADLLQGILAQFAAEARRKGISLIFSAQSSPTHADRDRLRQVFVNLVSNALAYTECGEIRVDLMKDNDYYRATVRDSGSGIAAEDLPHVFERFYRADKSRNRATGGVGIGLTVANAIVHAHQGLIAVESIQGEGSCFIVRLPRR